MSGLGTTVKVSEGAVGMKSKDVLSEHVTFTARARVAAAGKTQSSHALTETFDLSGTVLRTTLARLSKGVAASAIETELKERFGINRRAARAAIVSANGMRDAVIEGATTRLVGVKERIERLQNRIAKVKAAPKAKTKPDSQAVAPAKAASKSKPQLRRKAQHKA